MKLLILFFFFQAIYSSIEQDGKLDPLDEMIDALGRTTNSASFDKLTEDILGHLVGPPLPLGTPGNEVLEPQDFPGFVLPPEVGGPQGNSEDADIIFRDWTNKVDRLVDALKEVKQDGDNRFEALDFIQKVRDVAENFRELVNTPLNPNDPLSIRIIELQDNQEIEITNAAKLPIRLGVRGVPEASYQINVPHDGSAVVLKEFLGLKSILVCRSIPIWQEPWSSRRRIIGYKRVYYLKFVPCEYLKSITYKDTSAGVKMDVNTRQHCDRALLSYWNYPIQFLGKYH